MFKNVLSKLNKNNRINEEDKYSCEMDEAATAELLFIKLRNEIANANNKYGEGSDYVIMGSDISYAILFVNNIARLRIFNRLNYLLQESIGYKMEFVYANNAKLYGLGNKIIVSKM